MILAQSCSRVGREAKSDGRCRGEGRGLEGVSSEPCGKRWTNFHAVEVQSGWKFSCAGVPVGTHSNQTGCDRSVTGIARVTCSQRRTHPIAINARERYYTGNFRFWCARPLIADASLCPAMTRTPSSIRVITLSAVQDCRKAMPFFRQAAKTRSRAICISNG
jgi:hypothetical protein